MIITYEHNLEREVAYQRLCQAIEKYQIRVSNLDVDWDETNTHANLRARYLFANLSGQIDLEGNKITLQGEVPRIILSTFGRNIKKRAINRLEQIFS
jgi:hypothetical protein